MTRQKLARLKLKAYTAAKKAAIVGERFPTLPDMSGDISDLAAVLQAQTDGYGAGLRLAELDKAHGKTH